MDMSGCSAIFSRRQLQRFLSERNFAKLESLQQDEDVQAAGLDGLHECPFCNFKAIPPPIEEDREFRCMNEECSRVSCRLCDKVTHVPMSCEEAKRDHVVDAQHALEEARTEAMVRKCNKCGTRFVKDEGCNKMACHFRGCNNIQCYVCSKDVSDYAHFGDGRCPLFENTEKRHEDEAGRAEETVRARLRAANPNLTEEQLEVKFTKDVKKDDRRRHEAAQAAFLGRGPYPGRVRAPAPLEIPPMPMAIANQLAFQPPQYYPPPDYAWHIQQHRNQIVAAAMGEAFAPDYPAPGNAAPPANVDRAAQNQPRAPAPQQAARYVYRGPPFADLRNPRPPTAPNANMAQEAGRRPGDPRVDLGRMVIREHHRGRAAYGRVPAPLPPADDPFDVDVDPNEARQPRYPFGQGGPAYYAWPPAYFGQPPQAHQCLAHQQNAQPYMAQPGAYRFGAGAYNQLAGMPPGYRQVRPYWHFGVQPPRQ